VASFLPLAEDWNELCNFYDGKDALLEHRGHGTKRLNNH